jgi:rhodanese-related sulfurtransferase
MTSQEMTMQPGVTMPPVLTTEPVTVEPEAATEPAPKRRRGVMRKPVWWIGGLVVLLVVGVVSFSQLHHTSHVGTTDSYGVTSANLATTRSLIAHGAFVLDVRVPSSFAAGRVQGSVNIPLAEVQDRHGELPRNRTIVTVCSHGGQSYKAAFALHRLGYHVINLAGGLISWQAAGLPLIDTNGAPGTLVY